MAQNQAIQIKTIIERHKEMLNIMNPQLPPLTFENSLIGVLKSTNEQNIYNQIEESLQKQQALNRNFIKKQLQFKQYHKGLIEQICESKEENKKLNSKITKVLDELRNKDIEILQLSNEKKAFLRINVSNTDTSGITKMLNKKLQQHMLNQPHSDYQSRRQKFLYHDRRKSEQIKRKRPESGRGKQSSATKFLTLRK